MKLCFSGCVHWLLPSPQAPLRGIQLPCLDSLHGMFVHIDETPLSILHLFGLKNPTSLYSKGDPVSQSSFWPCNGLAPVVQSLSFALGSSELDTALQVQWGRAEQRGRISPDLLATLFLSAQNTHGLFYCKSALLAHVMPQLSLLPSRTSSKAAFQSPGPQDGLGFFYSTPGAGYCLSLCGNSRDFTFSSLLSIISRQVTAQPHLLLNLHRFFFKGCLCYTRF